MIKQIYRAAYLSITTIIILSIVLTGWTTFTYLSNDSRKSEITYVVLDIYENQKTILFDFIKLSKLLIKKTNQVIENKDASMRTELDMNEDINDINPKEIVEDEENESNPFGITIVPSDESNGNSEPNIGFEIDDYDNFNEIK